MSKELKILIVEDLPTDCELIEMELEEGGISFQAKRVETREQYRESLISFSPDVILSDYTLPGFGALEALAIKQQLGLQVPFILVTGAQSEEIAVDCIKRGADDYILKSSLTRLPTALTNAIQKKDAEKANSEALEALKVREEKYRNLFQNSLVGMFRANASTLEILDANDVFIRLFEIKNGECDAKDFFAINPLLHQFFLQIRNNNHITNKELLVTKCSGAKIWISVSAKYFVDEEIIEGVITDITESKSNFQKLEKMNQELERFAYHASHDLRSPLKSMIALITAAEEETSLEEKNALLDMMKQCTERLDILVNDLLDLAKLNQAEETKNIFDFKDEVSLITSDLYFLPNTKKINFITHFHQTHSFVSDKLRLRSIITNLISNAIKYHDTKKESPYINIDVEVDVDRAVIKVEDNGSGIDKRELDKIFEMFYRCKTDEGGTGLGLYLVKTTVDKLNGSIEVFSEKGKGTTFIITIPNLVSKFVPTSIKDSVIHS